MGSDLYNHLIRYFTSHLVQLRDVSSLHSPHVLTNSNALHPGIRVHGR
jgi:hypothetical protein